MANGNNEIGGIVKKCKILLLDVEGTTTSISFVKDKLFPYAEEKVKQFLESKWDEEAVKEVVVDLRKLALEDKEKNVEGVVAIPGEDATKEEQIEGLVNSVKWLMSVDRKAGPLKLLQGHIWKEGYENGDIKGHVYDDVSPALEQWRSTEGQKIYIYSSGSEQAQKLLFKQSVAGDLLPMIDGHFDTAVGAKQEAASYVAIAEKIGCKSEDILFLTDIIKEAEAARASGLHVALVSREGNAPLPDEATATYPVLHSFAQLAVSNKRKTELQDEQPAKVAKTELNDEVKAPEIEETPKATDLDMPMEASETEIPKEAPEAEIPKEAPEAEITKDAPVAEITKEAPGAEIPKEVPEVDTPKAAEAETPKEATEAETPKDVPEAETPKETELPTKTPEEAKKTEIMEVEETASVEQKSNEETEEKMDESPDTEIVVEEITDSNDAPVSIMEPVVEENVEKTEEKETEKMDTDTSETVTTTAPTVEDKKEAPAVDEKKPTVITEIEEITDKPLPEVAEIIDDFVPVVEEPTTSEDIEELQSVGEVLEKECDEILSKVQDVTNLDNIPLKPLLNPIAEETMETDNVDSNDIVDRILDTELEMEMKQCDDIDLSTVAEITETKTVTVAEKADEEKVTTTNDSLAEEKPSPMENTVEMNVVTEKETIETNIVTENETVETNVVIEKEVAKNIESEKEPESSPTELTETKVAPEPKVAPETKVEDTEMKQTPSVENKEISETQSAATDNVETNATAETKENMETVPEPAKTEEVKEPQVNGKATNGDTETANLNGDASKTEELNARLSVENGKEEINGANGESVDAEQGQGDNKIEAEVSDIKVKTVAVDEPRTDPIEQPTEA